MKRLKILTILGVLAIGQPVVAASCNECSSQVVLAPSDKACLLRRLTRQLAARQEPILLVTTCNEAKDRTRLDPPPTPWPSGSVGKAVLLTRSNAQCLARQLKALPESRLPITIDLRRC